MITSKLEATKFDWSATYSYKLTTFMFHNLSISLLIHFSRSISHDFPVYSSAYDRVHDVDALSFIPSV